MAGRERRIGDGQLVYSPRSRDAIEAQMVQGMIGSVHEICTPKQHHTCEMAKSCMAPVDTKSPGAFTICRGAVIRAAVVQEVQSGTA